MHRTELTNSNVSQFNLGNIGTSHTEREGNALQKENNKLGMKNILTTGFEFNTTVRVIRSTKFGTLMIFNGFISGINIVRLLWNPLSTNTTNNSSVDSLINCYPVSVFEVEMNLSIMINSLG